MTIAGLGAGELTIDAGGTSRHFRVNGGVTAEIAGLTLTGGDAGTDGGGAIFNSGTLTVTGSTLSGNTAGRDGGAIDHVSGALTLRHATLALNRADADGDGSGAGGGISNAASLTLHNTLVAGNFAGTGTAADDLSGRNVEAASSHNLIGDAATGGGLTDGTNGNLVGYAAADVIETVLRDNGGPTRTHALLRGSAAVDAGDDGETGGATTDQRGAGFARSVGDAVDVGAVEAQANERRAVLFIGGRADFDAGGPLGATLVTPRAGQRLTIDVGSAAYPDGVSRIVLDDSAAALASLTILDDDASGDLLVTIAEGANPGGLRFRGGSGGETVILNGAAAGLSFFGGDGDDVFMMGVNGSISTRGALTVEGGDGDDTLSPVDLGAGDDRLVLAGAALRGSANLQLGAGGDEAVLTDVAAGGNVGVNARRGAGGSDTVSMDEVFAGNVVAILTGDDGDEVDLTEVAARRFDVRLGGGDDALDATGLTVRAAAAGRTCNWAPATTRRR